MRRAATLTVFALPVLASALAVGASAQKRNSNAPIDFAADHMELQDKSNRVILTGNVQVKQDDMTLRAARITVAYTGKALNGSPQASRLDASGGVTVVQRDKTARGQYGIYDVNRKVVIMLGGVSLTQGPNTVNGSKLTINLDTGKAVVDGSGAVSNPETGAPITSNSGRVTGRFTVPKRNQ